MQPARRPGAGRHQVRFGVVVLLAALLVAAAQGVVADRVARAVTRDELVRRTVAATTAAQALAATDPAVPLSRAGSDGQGLVVLAADPEAAEVLVLARDGAVLTRVLPGGPVAPGAGAAGAQQVTTTADAARAGQVARALAEGTGVLADGTGTALVTVPWHGDDGAVAVQVRWYTDATDRRADVFTAAAVLVLAAGALLTVPTWFVCGGRRLVREHVRLRHRARHDELTGLGVRSAFHADLVHACEVPPPAGLGVHLVLVEPGGLALVQDAYGRRHAEALLQRAAAVVRGAHRARPDQVRGVYRVGGDCFAAVLLVPDPGAALEIAEEMRRRIAAAAQPLTASAGVAELDQVRCTDAETVLVAADAALQEARLMGGNRVVRSGEPGGGLRWEVAAGTTEDLLRELQAEIDGLIASTAPGAGAHGGTDDGAPDAGRPGPDAPPAPPGSLDLRDLPGT